MPSARGSIRNRDVAAQLRDFSGLCFGDITPTDIDGMIEYRNKGYVYIEAKGFDARVPHGQSLALVRQHDDMSKVKPVLTIFADHYATLGQDVDYAKATIRKFRFGMRWHEPKDKIIVYQVVSQFLMWLDHKISDSLPFVPSGCWNIGNVSGASVKTTRWQPFVSSAVDRKWISSSQHDSTLRVMARYAGFREIAEKNLNQIIDIETRYYNMIGL